MIVKQTELAKPYKQGLESYSKHICHLLHDHSTLGVKYVLAVGYEVPLPFHKQCEV